MYSNKFKMPIYLSIFICLDESQIQNYWNKFLKVFCQRPSLENWDLMFIPCVLFYLKNMSFLFQFPKCFGHLYARISAWMLHHPCLHWALQRATITKQSLHETGWVLWTEKQAYLIPVANAVGERESRDKVSITLREEKRKVLLLNVFKTKHFYYNALIITATVKKKMQVQQRSTNGGQRQYRVKNLLCMWKTLFQLPTWQLVSQSITRNERVLWA